MHMLIGAGIPILKYYLDNCKKQQKNRLRTRHDDPLKQWKTSPIDKVALKRFEMYTEARDQMLVRTSSSLSPLFRISASFSLMMKRTPRPACCSGRHELSHHAVVLMLKDMTMVHEGGLHGRLGETYEKLDSLAHQHCVPRACVAHGGLASIAA